MCATSAANRLDSAEQRRAFYDALADAHDAVIPVIGAGLATAAGVPSSTELAAALRRAAAEPAESDADLFGTADRLADSQGEAWVRSVVASTVTAAPPRPTPPLQALARVPSRLILTTNYDLAIEQAAAASGVACQTLTLADAARVIDPSPGDILRVLHLHGLADEPDSIVLTRATYDHMLEDERLRLLIRFLGVGKRLVFLGHRLDDREHHLRRDLMWAARAKGGGSAVDHLVLTGSVDLSDPQLAARAGDLERNAGVSLVAFADPEGTYRFINAVASVLAGPAAGDLAGVAPQIDPQRVDPNYLAMTVAPAEDIASPMARGAYQARTWLTGDVTADELDSRERRLLLVGGGGHGKSQELLQIATRSREPALYKTLAGVDARDDGVGSEATFLSWMADACAVKSDVPVLTAHRLLDGAYTLLLDGLDEVPTPHRSRVVRVLNDMVRAHPQHRWVITSRHLPENLPHLDGFTTWTLLASHRWLTQYATRRGADPTQLDEMLRAVPGMPDLAVIPVYAVAALRHVLDRRPTPPTARELVLGWADEQFEAKPGLRALPQDLRCWLDRLALLLQLRNEHEITLVELASADLHDLPGLAPDSTTLAELATRALLFEDGGTARFPATVVQEARAARALREAGDSGLTLVERAVAVALSDEPSSGAASAVRSSWSNTLMLALADAPASWKEVVRQADPVLAARITPRTAAEEDRHAAIWTLWKAYEARRVWLDRGMSPARHNDAGALLTLLAAGVPPDFTPRVLAALGHEEPVLRGNALELVPTLLDRSAALPLVKAALTDPHPVVRRHAAVAAFVLRATDFVDTLLEQANADPDEMAAQTLADIAMDLAPTDHLIALFTTITSPRIADRARLRLIERVDRLDLLREVRAGHLDLPLLEDLTDASGRHTRNPWTPPQVVELAHITAEHEDALLGAASVERVLSEHSRLALAVWLTHPEMAERDFEVWQLLSAWSDADLDSLDAQLSEPVDLTRRLAPDFDIGVAAPTTTAVVRNIVTEALRARRDPPLRPRRPLPPTLPELVAAGDRDGALLRSPPQTRDEPLSAAMDAVLREWVRDRFAQLDRDGALSCDRGDPPRSRNVEWARSIAWAAWADLPLPAEVWAGLAPCVLTVPGDEIRRWMRSHASKQAWLTLHPQLAAWSASDVLALPRLFPIPWPDGLAQTLLDRLDDDALDDGTRLSAAAGALAAGQELAVRAWLPTPPPTWARPLQVRLGDAHAEAVLLAELIVTPDAWSRWPVALGHDWMSHVRHSESAPALHQLIAVLLRHGHEFHDIEAVFAAYERCAGDDAPPGYTALMADPTIPAGRYLHYQRQRAIDSLAEQRALAAVGEPSDTAALVRELVPPPRAAAG